MLLLCICSYMSFARLSSATRCFNQRGVDRRAARLIMSIHCFRTAVSDSFHLQRHCLKLHTGSLPSVQYNNRSLSPWRYRIDERENRIPSKIMVAECLYTGCIINKHEDMTYNSVPVLATFTVLQKTVCPDNPRHYLVTVNVVTIPVACTCVVPRQMI
ncbi:interleukin-17C-like [Salvelinus fontinalis]|uniref:interleukin-17C-like n=1 Tax=Salvelinus fontinalis TaxID=8038 RepID=UPI00248665AF|nr:interleukin-17C-like [Salvelinus fontinalis]